MRKLLHANANRVLISRVFWIEMTVWVVYCLGYQLDSYCRSMEYSFPLQEIFQQTMFSFTTLMGVFFAIFVSLYIGTEYNDGTIRNKLIVGQTRNSIYLSNYIACTAAGIVHTTVAAAVFLSIGVLVFGKPELGAGQFLQILAIILFLCMSYASVYTFISMLCGSKAHASIINILAAFGMLFAGALLSSRLLAPKMIADYGYVDGALAMKGQTPNPNYLSGTKRTVYQLLMDFIPGGQNIQLSQNSLMSMLLEHPVQLCCYSAAITVIFTLAGMLIFNRKDIK